MDGAEFGCAPRFPSETELCASVNAAADNVEVTQSNTTGVSVTRSVIPGHRIEDQRKEQDAKVHSRGRKIRRI